MVTVARQQEKSSIYFIFLFNLLNYFVENENDCELYDNTSSAQTDHESISTIPDMKRKRVVKKRKYNDFIEC